MSRRAGAAGAATRRAGRRPIDIETLWRFDRVGAVSLAPDGRCAVVSVSTPSMADNTVSTSLWLLPTDGADPRRLTRCGDRDGQPAWSPRGGAIAFIARRDQQGRKDTSPQIHLVAPDGGEARRVSDFAPGVESFKWLPDGRRIVFASWVWPGLKGEKSQAKRHREFADRRETGYATGAAFYRYWDHDVPMDRALHLLLLDTVTGRVTDLFEGSGHELPRDAEGSTVFDVSPDGRRIVFAQDPADEPLLGNRLALVELKIAKRRFRTLVDDAAWDFGSPTYSPDGRRIAAIAAPVGRAHTALGQLAVIEPGRLASPWRLLAPGWDRAVDSPLRWAPGGDAIRFTAQDRGRCHLWRQRLDAETPEVVVAGGWVHGHDVAAGIVVTVADSSMHPPRVHAHRESGGGDDGGTVRVDRFNDERLAGCDLGDVREVTVAGALGDDIQVWLTFPPGFDAKRRHPLLQVIHGGPFAAAGDTFGWRWNAHLLASRGHVVAQVNYHGSSGFGFDFRHSLIGRQGELELQDVEAATDWLLAQRWADRGNVFAAGGSYGGFLVAWMNGHVAPGRYRAYVCHAGVFDRIATFSADSWPTRPKDLGARYWEDLPRVLAQSPATFAGAMSTPTLVIHGARDYRVPDCNGLAYYNTLKARGVPARLLWFPDENHWVLKPRNARQWIGEFHDWLAAHRGTAPTPARLDRHNRGR